MLFERFTISMAVCSTLILAIGSENWTAMQRKLLTVWLHPPHLYTKKKSQCAKNCHFAVYPHIHVANCIPGALFFSTAGKQNRTAMKSVYNNFQKKKPRFSGFWLPGPAPVIDKEVQVNSTKPFKLADNRWQLRLTFNGNENCILVLLKCVKICMYNYYSQEVICMRYKFAQN